MNENKVHRVTDKSTVTRCFRVLPYSEIAELLKNGETAFFENTREQPLKRQTIWKASKKLSRLTGKTVVAARGVMKVDGTQLEGYLFMVESKKATHV